jgi:hypothetical protein
VRVASADKVGTSCWAAKVGSTNVSLKFTYGERAIGTGVSMLPPIRAISFALVTQVTRPRRRIGLTKPARVNTAAEAREEGERIFMKRRSPTAFNKSPDQQYKHGTHDRLQ